ncbi:MAG: DUF6273 domain-containing protein [Treponema sp.]|nr:DUF6273 domain-containing protein [Treponema sp.]
MKNRLFLLMALFALVCLTSCENFLKGEEVKKEIEESIAYANAKECTLIVKSDPAYGSFLSEGEKKCKLGYTINLQFTVTTQDYMFMGLEAVSTNNPSESRSDCVEFNITNSQEAAINGIYKITVKLLKDTNDILIRPVFEKLKNADLKLACSHGTLKPEENTYNLIIGRSFDISFNAEEDWEFVRWQIYNEETKEEIQNGIYLEIADIKQKETSFIFKGVPESFNTILTLRPVVAERPQIIANNPQNSGILKDCCIQVLFDHDMDPFSIYYTEPEIWALQALGVKDSEFLPAITDTPQNHYGYTKDGKTYFKNISLSNNKSGANINDRFEAPFFENARTLSIPASKKVGSTLDDFTQVLVTIEKNFFYSEPIPGASPKQVTLRGSKKWMYQITNHGDEEALVFQKKNGKDLFELKLENEQSATSLNTASSHPTISSNGNGISTLKFLKLINEKPTLYCDMELQDVTGGSGPNSTFSIYYERIKEADYITAGQDQDKTGKFTYDYINTTSQDALFKGNLELDLPQDGLYRIWFDFSDRSKNHFYYPVDSEKDNSQQGFYVVKDTGINMAAPSITDTSSENGVKLLLEWTPTPDLKISKIRYKKSGGAWSNYEDFPINTTSKEYKNLDLNSNYEFEIINTDYIGNTQQTISINEKTTDYDKITITGTPKKTVYLKGESFDGTGLTITGYLTNGHSWNAVNDNNFSSSQICWQGKTVTISHTINGVTKSANINATYYVAQADALTNTPVKLTGYSGTLNGGTYYKFGDFPQTIKQSSVNVSENLVYNGWYLGSDGYFYEKCKAILRYGEVTSATNICSDGTVLEKNTFYYFKVEPIKWCCLNNSENGNKLLYAENILTGSVSYGPDSQKNRIIDGKTVFANNYEYSRVRAYLNGYKYIQNTDNGTEITEKTTFLNNGFFQKAFTLTAQSKIQDTTVINNNSEYGVCASNNTTDKIFLLSVSELKNTNYGFANNDSGDQARKRATSDYALATYAYKNKTTNNGYFMLRSPVPETTSVTGAYYNITGVSDNGGIYNVYSTNDDCAGIVPAMYVNIN